MNTRIAAEMQPVSPTSATTATPTPMDNNANIKFDLSDEEEVEHSVMKRLWSYNENTDWLRECGATPKLTLWKLRIERGLRFISMIPLALFLSYSNICGANFAYLIVIMYTILSALMPPNPPTFNMMALMGLPAGILGACAATTILFSIMFLRPYWAYDHQATNIQVHKSLLGWVTVALYVGFLVPVVVWKTGPLVNLMVIPLYSYTYTMQQLLCNLFLTVKNGIQIELPIETVKRMAITDLDILFKYAAGLGQKMLQTQQSFVDTAVKKFRHGIFVNISNTYAQKLNCFLFSNLFDRTDPSLPLIRTGECRILLPHDITRIDSSLSSLVGSPVLVKSDMTTGIQIHMNLHTNFLKFLWLGKRHYSMMVGVLISAALVIGLVSVSHFIPMPRFMRSVLRMSIFSNLQACKLQAVQLSIDPNLEKSKQITRYLDAGAVPIIKGIRQKTRFIVFKRIRQTMDLRDLYKIKHSSTLPFFDEMILKVDACKGPLLLSLFEHGLFSPIGANTYYEGSPVLEALKHNATHHSAMVETLPLTGRGADWQEELRHMNPAVSVWLWECVQDSLRLQQMIETAIGLKNAISADRSQLEMLNDTRIQVENLMNKLKERQLEFLSYYKGDVSIKVLILGGLLIKYTDAHAFDKRDVSEHISYWRTVLEEFYWIYIENPIKAAEVAFDWISGQLDKSGPRLRTSILGFFAPLGLLVITLLKPWGKFLKWFFKTIFFMRKYPKSPAPVHINNMSAPTTGFNSWSSSALLIKSNRRMKRRLGEFFYFCVCLRFILGSTALLALILFVPRYSQRLWTHKVPESEINTVLDGAISIDVGLLKMAKASSWTLLGFLTCIYSTVEGTLKRSCLRLIGVATGTFLAWLCLLWFPTNTLMHGVWLCVTEFIVVVLAAHPTLPQVGFHPSWGYAAQLFTYQQTIIVVESYLNPRRFHRDEIVVQRLIGQCVGIGAAVVTSLLICPTRITPACRHKLGDCIFSLRNMTESLIQMTLSDLNISQPDQEWNAYYKRVNKILTKDLQEEENIRADNKVLEELPLLRTPAVIQELYIYCSRMACIRRELYGLLTDDEQMSLLDIEGRSDPQQHSSQYLSVTPRQNNGSIIPRANPSMIPRQPPSGTPKTMNINIMPPLKSVCEGKTIASMPPGVMIDDFESPTYRAFTSVHVEGSHYSSPPNQFLSDIDEDSEAAEPEVSSRSRLLSSARRVRYDTNEAYYSDRSELVMQEDVGFGASLPTNVTREDSNHSTLLSEDSEMERRLVSPTASRGGTFLLNRHHRKVSPANIQSGYSPVSGFGPAEFASIMVPEPSPTSKPPMATTARDYLPFSELYATTGSLERISGSASAKPAEDSPFDERTDAASNVYWLRYEDMRKERDTFVNELDHVREMYRQLREDHEDCDAKQAELEELRALVAAAEQKALEDKLALEELERQALEANLPKPPQPAASLEEWGVPCIFQTVQPGLMSLWECLARVYTLIEFGVHRGGRRRTFWKCLSYKYTLIEWDEELARAFDWLDRSLDMMRVQTALCSVIHRYADQLDLHRHRLDTYSCGPKKIYLLDRLLEFLRAEISILKRVKDKVVEGGIWVD